MESCLSTQDWVWSHVARYKGRCGVMSLTWGLSLLLLWAPGVGAALQQGREQQQRGLPPLVAVARGQRTVAQEAQPLHKTWKHKNILS